MRDLLTILATALILLLTAALAGPWFVDWTAHRGWIESELARITATRVRVQGEVDLKLLPVPKLSLRDVRVASNRADGPVLDISRVRFELAAASLLRGELRFIDAELERPQLTLSLREDGGILSPRIPHFSPSGVQIEKLSVKDGSLAFRAPGQKEPVVVGGLDFSGEATSLLGPFRGSGALRLGSEPVKWRFATGSIENDRLRAKIVIDESKLGPRADLEGFLAFAGDLSGGLLTFDGQSAFSGTTRIGGVPVPWRVSGNLQANHGGARMEEAEVRAGEDERALVANGALSFEAGPSPRTKINLTARQLDLDRLFNAPGQSAARRLLALAGEAASDSGFAEQWPFALEASLNAPALTLAAETITDLRADVSLAHGETPRVKIAAQGPARSSMSLDGALETGAAAAFRGKIDLSARDVQRLSTWLALFEPQAARLYDLPFRSVDLAGDVEVSGVGAIGRNMQVRLDRSEFSGALAFTRAQANERARLFADLGSEALDLEGLPELTGPARFASDMDLSLALDARAVRLERFGAGYVDAGRIGVKLLRDAGGTRIERFTIDNIGGANVNAEGRIGEQGADMSARVDAQRLGDLAALLQRVAPGAFADAIAQRAVALSPLRLNLSLRGRELQAPEEVKAEGSARGTRFTLTAKPSNAQTEIGGLAENNDAALLLRQIGVETLPISGSGAGRVQLRASGNAQAGFNGALSFNAARVDAVFEGLASGSLADPQVSGNLRLRSNDASSFLRLTGFGLPDVSASLPFEGAAEMKLAKGMFTFDHVSGIAAGAFFSGALRSEDDEGLRRWAGQLKLDRLSLPSLAMLALGPQAFSQRNSAWSDQKFAPGLADAPRMRLDLTVADFELADNMPAREAAFRLRLESGLVALENARMAFSQGTLGGDLVLRRDGAAASLALKADLAHVALPAGPVSGFANGRVELTSTGQSYAALAAGLAGEGRAEIDALAITNADPAALARFIGAVDRGQVNVEERDLRTALLRELERAGFSAAKRTYAVSAAAGVLRLDSAEAPRVTLSFDARQWSAEARLALGGSAPKDWQGDAPAATLVWQGKLGSMQRSVDAAPLFNAVSARAIQREAARVESLEEDIRERAAFNRRAKAFDFMRRREREISAFHQEERRRVEAQRQRERERAADPLASGRF